MKRRNLVSGNLKPVCEVYFCSENESSISSERKYKWTFTDKTFRISFVRKFVLPLSSVDTWNSLTNRACSENSISLHVFIKIPIHRLNRSLYSRTILGRVNECGKEYTSNTERNWLQLNGLGSYIDFRMFKKHCVCGESLPFLDKDISVHYKEWCLCIIFILSMEGSHMWLFLGIYSLDLTLQPPWSHPIPPPGHGTSCIPSSTKFMRNIVLLW